jgi:hypothetical protein
MEGVEVPDSIRVPDEAHDFSPSRDIVIRGEGKKIDRYIFHNQPLEAIEQRSLAELENLVQAKGLEGLSYPPHWSQAESVRCLYGTGWKADKARKVLIAHLRWHTTIPADYRLLFESVHRVLNIGIIYLHGRDSYFRPMLVLNVTRFDLNLFSVEDLVNSTVFLLEYVKANMLQPGVIENWVTIADLGNLGLTSLPISSFKSVSHVLQENYRCRLALSYVVNSPRSISFIWGMIKPFIDKMTVKKISFHRESSPQPLFTHCNHSQVERKYGGSAPDVTHFWPPTVPQGPFRIIR